MFKKVLFILSALALARAQIPSLGWCPDYAPMPNFDMGKFLGIWYEAERYFQLSEVVSRCVMANYTRAQDGKLRVSNQVTNRFTGIKRILEGEIKPLPAKSAKGKLSVKYTTVPLTPETSYSVLDTDYKNYAVMWSCSGIGPVHAQNAWVMTRERPAPPSALQKAYATLDAYKISRTFFVKTDQEDCALLDAIDATPAPVAPETPAETAEEEETVPENQNLRTAIVPDAADIIIQTRKTELNEKKEKAKLAEEKLEKPKPEAPKAEETPEIPEAEPIQADQPAEVSKPVETKPEPVAQVILKTAEVAKEAEKKPEAAKEDELPKKEEELPKKEVQKAEPVLADEKKTEEPVKEVQEAPKEEEKPAEKA